MEEIFIVENKNFDQFYSDEDKDLWTQLFLDFKSKQKSFSDKSIGIQKWDDTIKEFRVSEEPKVIKVSPKIDKLTPSMTYIYYFAKIQSKIEQCKDVVNKSRASQSLDLLRAVNTFRTYRTVEETLKNIPELREQAAHMEILYDRLSSLNEEELSILVEDMIHELEQYLGD